ncbi:MAG: helix-hairpin-helix domain-containing protein [Candidatus Bipolaricaulota bacterium]|nr:helix-hairpin-helix domain-containing protein [Candidatus Bipolaricaulota bacterium]MBS3791468.1 helix-hairpin-helix domain-containing protein [Candidatus Bipolaricaulota bacterium]
MIELLKKSDRLLLLVGLFIGCIALSHPFLKGFFGSRSPETRLSQVNGRPLKLEEVKVRTPEFVDRDGKINLNTADPERLEELSGIGSVLAERIVAYRTRNGGFSSLAELKEVSGIGPSTLNRIKERLKVESGSS